MGLFTKKDPTEAYSRNKQAYLAKASVKKNTDTVYLRLYKTRQAERSAQLYVQVTEGVLRIGDLLELECVRGNRLGVHSVVGRVGAIYQILSSGGLTKRESLAPTDEAYENDLVWVEVPDIDVTLLYASGQIRKSKAQNVVAEDTVNETVSVSYDEEVSKMVNYFKSELYAYFTERTAIGHITQDLGYSLLAQRKRLDRKGITMTIERSADIDSVTIGMEVQRYSSSQFDVAEVNEAIKLKRSYRSAGREIYRDEDWRICHYLLAGAKNNATGMLLCPSCGNYAAREELLVGCPYCGTHFTIRDLSLRVAGYSQKQVGQTFTDKLRGRVDLGFSLYHEGKQKEYDQVLKYRMAQIDPLFSPTAFYNSMRNKLYSIVFAEDANALRNLADEDFDVAPSFPQFEDVIDLDIQEIETKNFKKSDPYVLIDVVMNAMLLHYQASAGNAVWKRNKITMSFVKHLKNQTTDIFEPSKVHCQSCGGAYSLYDGKACTYCGHTIDYPMYDWLLIDLAVETLEG